VTDNNIWMSDDESGRSIIKKEFTVINEDMDKILLEEVAEMCGYVYDKFGNKNLKASFDKKGHKVCALIKERIVRYR